MGIGVNSTLKIVEILLFLSIPPLVPFVPLNYNAICDKVQNLKAFISNATR